MAKLVPPFHVEVEHSDLRDPYSICEDLSLAEAVIARQVWKDRLLKDGYIRHFNGPRMTRLEKGEVWQDCHIIDNQGNFY